MPAALWTDHGRGDPAASCPQTYSLWARWKGESWAERCHLHPGMRVSGKSLPRKCGHPCPGPPQPSLEGEGLESGWGIPVPLKCTNTWPGVGPPNAYPWDLCLKVAFGAKWIWTHGSSQPQLNLPEYVFLYALVFNSGIRVRKLEINVL